MKCCDLKIRHKKRRSVRNSACGVFGETVKVERIDGFGRVLSQPLIVIILLLGVISIYSKFVIFAVSVAILVMA